MLSSNSFLPLLTHSNKISYSQINTESHISDFGYCINQQFIQLLNKSNICPCLLVCLDSHKKQNNSSSWYRALLLQQYNQQPIRQSSDILFFNKLQYSLNRNSSDAKNWIYIQLSHQCINQQKLVEVCELLGIFATNIILFQQDFQLYKQFIRSVYMKKNDLNKVNYGQIYIMSKTDEHKLERFSQIFDKQSDKENMPKLMTIKTGIQNTLSYANTQTLQSLINQGRSIVQNCPLQLVKSELLVNSIKNILQNDGHNCSLREQIEKMDKIQQEMIINNWLKMYHKNLRDFLPNNSQSPIIISQLYENNADIYNKIQEQTIKKQPKNSQKILKVLEQQFMMTVQAILKNNVTYLKQLFNKQLDELCRKHTNKVSILFTEISNLRANFNKKIQQYLNIQAKNGLNTSIVSERSLQQIQCKYQIPQYLQLIVLKYSKKFSRYCQQSILNSLQKTITNIISNIQHNNQIRNQQTKQQHNTQIQKIKQSSRQLSKQLTCLQAQKQNLQKNYKITQQHQNLLEQNLTELRQQLSSLSHKNQKQLQQCQSKYLRELAQYRNNINILNQKLSNTNRQLTIINSEIDKQKLLHEQTKNYYQCLISEYKISESRLQQKVHFLSQQNIQSQHNLQSYRRQVQQNTSILISRTQADISPRIREIQRLQHNYQKLQKQYKDYVDRTTIINQANLTKIQQLQKANEELQSHYLQNSTTTLKNRVSQQQIQVLQMQIKQTLQIKNQYQMKIALLSQQNTFLNSTLSEMREKLQKSTKQIHQMDLELINIKDKYKKQQKQYSQQWTQTQQHVIQQYKLKQALNLVQCLQKQYYEVRQKLNQYIHKEKMEKIQGIYRRKLY